MQEWELKTPEERPTILTPSELNGLREYCSVCVSRGQMSEENTHWSWCPLLVIIKVNFEGRIWIPEIAQNASTLFTATRSEDLEVKHMSWQLDQLETSSETIVQDSGHRRNLSEILYPVLTNHISR